MNENLWSYYTLPMIKPWFSGKKKRNNEKLLGLKATAIQLQLLQQLQLF